MATVAELVFKAAFGDLVQAKGVLGDLKNKTQEVQKEADKMGGSLSNASKIGLALGAAIGTTLTAVGALTARAIANADAIDELSQRVTVSTEALSGWAYGAKFAGVSQDELANSLIKLNNVMDDAFTGNAKAAESFERLGVSLVDNQGKLKGTEEMFLDVADAFAEIEDGASKTAIASELFGNAAGPALVPYLNQGRKGIEELNAEALKFGLIIKKEVGENAGKFNDQLDQMKGVVGGMATQIAAGLLPTMTHLGGILLDTANNTGSMEKMTKALSSGLRILASVASGVSSVFQTLGQGIGAVVAATWEAVNGNFKNAWTILKEGFKDAKDNISSALTSIDRIWDETSTNVEKKSPQTAKKLAAPATKAAKEVKDASLDISDTISRIFDIAIPERGILDDINQINKLMEMFPQYADVFMAALMKLNEQLDSNSDAFKDNKKEVLGVVKEYDKLVEKYIKIATPQGEYVDQLLEINELMEKFPQYAEYFMEAQMNIQEALDKSNSKMKETKTEQTEIMKELQKSIEGFGRNAADAFVGWIAGAKVSLKDFLREFLLDMAKMLAYQAIFKPIASAVGGFFGFSSGGIIPKAGGDVLPSTTYIPMANGSTAMAGEAGNEAIMPLKRNSAGVLGVSASGGGSKIVVEAININISDVKGEDAPSVQQAAAQGVNQALRGLVVNELGNQTRTGNMLNPFPLSAFG